MLNTNRYSQTGVWEQGRSPVGRVALIPTHIQTSKQFYLFIKALCANVFANIEHLIYANLFSWAIFRKHEMNQDNFYKKVEPYLIGIDVMTSGREINHYEK